MEEWTFHLEKPYNPIIPADRHWLEGPIDRGVLAHCLLPANDGQLQRLTPTSSVNLSSGIYRTQILYHQSVGRTSRDPDPGGRHTPSLIGQDDWALWRRWQTVRYPEIASLARQTPTVCHISPPNYRLHRAINPDTRVLTATYLHKLPLSL